MEETCCIALMPEPALGSLCLRSTSPALSGVLWWHYRVFTNDSSSTVSLLTHVVCIAYGFSCQLRLLFNLTIIYTTGDIKVANLLMQSDADDSPVKIIDFGSLIQLDHASMRVVTEEAHGSPMSMAPESLPTFSREYSTASDIWQAGCVLF